MADLSDMSLEKFLLWTVTSLKAFLSLRKKSVEGNHDELVARSFIAWEEKTPVNIDAEHEERKLLSEYKEKLLVDGQVLQDPFSLDVGWIREEEGINMWPSVYITDIASYLNERTPEDLVRQIINEYKVGKAYRYYSCDWVKEILYHNIRDNSSLCLLKAKVMPSMSLNSPAYAVWAAIAKESGTQAGGRVLSAYCTCTAGMLGSCNHISGLLFRVEAAVVTGATDKTCTDKQCEWTIPKQRVSLNPVPAVDLSWTKDHFYKHGKTTKRPVINKTSFTPLSRKQQDLVKDKVQIRNKLSAIAGRCAPEARFHKMMKKEAPAPLPVCVPSLPAMVDQFCATTPETSNKTPEAFIKQLSSSVAQCNQLTSATENQGGVEWKMQRKGRITASNFRRVYTRMETLDRDDSADRSALINHVMGYSESVQTIDMKHGVSCEPHAKLRYAKVMKKIHKKFKSSDSGIVVLPNKPYISASPDLIIDCECCGKGLCEIKCPATIKSEIPSVDNVNFIEINDGDLCIKTTDRYYAQIQGQMGILNRMYCDIFIFTFHGHLCVRVPFDKLYWTDMLAKMDKFWLKFVLPALFSKDVKGALAVTVPISMTPKSKNDTVVLLNVAARGTSSKRKQKRVDGASQAKRAKRAVRAPLFLCPVCGQQCIDEPSSRLEESIQCSCCNMWCHLRCGGVVDVPEDDDSWFCPKCMT
ncbi:uncharacterized protein LOC124115889 [Haliotis rufescens]|uniref:uncharacterized protein LOC124115889 n=1 Tax=Haliotis rufescens TaxID=6454 RepID=UPI00201F2D52|nr:uncharacterized protein LOC124115889 [Haliotis rufescens]